MLSIAELEVGGHLMAAFLLGEIGSLAAAAFCFISLHIHQNVSREMPSTDRSRGSQRSHPAAPNGNHLRTWSTSTPATVSSGPLSQTKKSGYTWLFSHQPSCFWAIFS